MKPWNYLWETEIQCQFCSSSTTLTQPIFRCFAYTNFVHHGCLMEILMSQKMPICQACGSSADRAEAEAVSPESMAEPGQEHETWGETSADPETIELRDPHLNPLDEIVLDTGTLPCSIHGYDHLARDTSCEFCKRAVGPLYRHLNKKYGTVFGDHIPTLSFDFSGPYPMAVTGARFMLLYVWRFDAVRLL